MLPLNISKYDESSKIFTCSNSLGDQPMSALIAQENIQDLYRIECKVVNYIEDNDGEEGKTKIQTLAVREKDKLLSTKRKTQSIQGENKFLELEQENEMLKLENEKLKLKLNKQLKTLPDIEKIGRDKPFFGDKKLERSFPFFRPGPSTYFGKQVMSNKQTEKNTSPTRSGNSTTCKRGNFRLDFFAAKRLIISYAV